MSEQSVMAHPSEAVREWVPAGFEPRMPAKPETLQPWAGSDAATVDLNEVSFEGLRALGLTIGEAALFISQRERRGGIESIGQIDGFIGLSPEVLATLRRHGSI